MRAPRRQESESIRSLRVLLFKVGFTESEVESFLIRLASDVADAGVNKATIDTACERFADGVPDAEARFGKKSGLASKMKMVAGGLALGVAGNLLTDLVKAGFGKTYSFEGLGVVREELSIPIAQVARECDVSPDTYRKAERGQAVSRAAGDKISAGIQRLGRRHRVRIHQSKLLGPDHGREIVSLRSPK